MLWQQFWFWRLLCCLGARRRKARNIAMAERITIAARRLKIPERSAQRRAAFWAAWPGAASASQKLIYIGEMEIESEQFEADYAALKEQVSALGGYLAGETLSGTAPVAYGDAGRYGQLVARIPTEHFQTFLDDADSRMNVVRRQVDVQDVTEYYYDNEARIELLETRYAKLEEHLRAAEKMEDIIALEQEMSEILSELDALKGTRRHLDHQVEYSTLTIEISEVVRSSGVATSKEGVGSRMGEAFNGTLRAIGVFFEDAAIFW